MFDSLRLLTRRFVWRPATWRDVLRWWVAPDRAQRTPTVTQVGRWHDFVSTEFAYRFTWGLKAMALSALEPDAAAVPVAWEGAGIPWAALWMKDMLQWGSADPVASYLLSRQVVDTRPEAEQLALGYYAGLDRQEIGDSLDPGAIRVWVAAQGTGQPAQPLPIERRIEVELSPRVADPEELGRWRVVPLATDEHIEWADMAGYVLASSALPQWWTSGAQRDYDFALNAPEREVYGIPFL
jgi:hypothetical protein